MFYPASYEPEMSQKKFCYTEIVILNTKAVSGFPETSVPPKKLRDVTSHKSVPVAITVVGK